MPTSGFVREGTIMTDTPDDSGVPDLTALLLSTKTLDAFLAGLAEAALALVPASDGCGVTLEREGHPLTVASAGTSAPRLDEKQYGQDDGPCLQALRTGQEVAVREVLSEHRWGGYPAYAAARGNRSSLSLPIAPRTHTAGALNLYASQPDAFADADLTSLRELAAQATGAIALAQQMTDVEAFTVELHQVLADRAVIDRAIGATMARHAFTYDQAFASLRNTAQSRGIPLRDVCAELLEGFGESPGGPTPPPTR
jgi:GAF domain-containing protein